jgi:hypothetical protein
MDCKCGSSGSVPALQVRSPEFKPQTYKENTVSTQVSPESAKKMLNYVQFDMFNFFHNANIFKHITYGISLPKMLSPCLIRRKQ